MVKVKNSISLSEPSSVPVIATGYTFMISTAKPGILIISLKWQEKIHVIWPLAEMGIICTQLIQSGTEV